MAQEKPVHEVRLGRVKAAIWRNETEVGPRFGIVITRIYKTEQGWESSSSFGREDLPLVAKVADLAHTWCYEHANERNETPDEDTEKSRASSKGRKREAKAESVPF